MCGCGLKGRVREQQGLARAADGNSTDDRGNKDVEQCGGHFSGGIGAPECEPERGKKKELFSHSFPNQFRHEKGGQQRGKSRGSARRPDHRAPARRRGPARLDRLQQPRQQP